MKLTGYRAFLKGTAADLRPVRGIWFQRCDNVEGAADQRASKGAASLKGVSESNGTHTA